MADIIKPGDMIARYGIDGLLEAVEKYYGSMTDYRAVKNHNPNDLIFSFLIGRCVCFRQP